MEIARKKYSEEEWAQIKKNAAKRQDAFLIKKIVAEKKKKDAIINKYGISNISPTKKAIKARQAKKVNNKVIVIHRKNDETKHYGNEKALYSGQGRDMYDFAREYLSREVEYGHGKKKNWNGVKGSGLRRDIRRGFKMQKQDPNSFDRQAMK